MIPYGRQSIDESDISAVVAVLRSDWLTQGPAVPAFEQRVADYCGAKHAIATSNATAALHLACLALEVGPSDLVWTSPISFVASANCARYCGADVDFVDIDPETANISIAALEEKLRLGKASGRLPKVLIPVDFAGNPCDLAQVRQLADEYGFAVIEDASHALGAKYCGARIGGGGYAEITVLSFHPVKMITTAEGGMALTGDPELAQRLRRLRAHGITRETREMQAAAPGGWYYEQIDLGFNYRMTDIQATLGISQMRRLEGFLAARREIASVYQHRLTEPSAQPLGESADRISSHHLFVVRLALAGTRKRVYEAMRSAGIGVNVHYIPIHLQPYYKRLGFGPGDFPAAEAFYDAALSLPIFPALTSAMQDAVIQALHTAVASCEHTFDGYPSTSIRQSGGLRS